ncbi:MAG: MauE/DoxX family redox-associated membrane protein [Acidimicrobiales bacterium]
MELIGLYLVGCALLVGAGVVKAFAPGDTARAIAAAVPVPVPPVRTVVRVGAVAEVLLGVAALAFPQPLSASLVALSYAGFAAFVFYARARGGAIASCGCFGTPDTPATAVHVIVNVGLSASAAAVALSDLAGSIVGILARQPGHGLPLAVASALCTWLAYLTVSRLAALQAARRLTAVSFGGQ